MAEPITSTLRLPFDLIDERRGRTNPASQAEVLITVPDDYESGWSSEMDESEVLAIQRLLTLCKNNKSRVVWQKGIASRALASPTILPLLAVLLTLDNATHSIEGMDDVQAGQAVEAARRALFRGRLKADLFSDTQIVICADSRGRGTPPDLYESDGSLIRREDFEAMIEELVSLQTAIHYSTSRAVKWSSTLATIVSELFENTEIHAKLDLSGAPILKNGIRGLILKRTRLAQPSHKNVNDRAKDPIEAFELSVFDSGPGFYSSFTRQPITAAIELESEWKIVHSCLERHYEPAIKESQQAHRGLGLYEVLRALLLVRGAIEVRTGRVYGYRTFLEGDFRFAMEPSTSATRPGMPRPQLLDHERRFVKAPTEHDLLLGSSIRIIVPLH